MKKILLLFGILLVYIPTLKAQNERFTKDFQPIRSELTKWDPVRGEWLASSLVSMSKNEPIPDRTFPEDFTPAEMLRMVPQENRINIQKTITANQQNASDSSSRTEWNSIASVISRPDCKLATGRTYGDPHLVSFDGASYSFQTVGEFVLAKSTSQNLEIQARQQSQSDDFSLNTALAMNVAGDRVCIYANEKPDNVSNTALRINGAPVSMSRNTYFLPHGGTIRYTSNTYIITWPSGETVNAQIKNTSKMNFINITTQVYPCAQQDLQGLLGNANGRESDDFDTQNASKRPAYMAFSSFGNSQMQQASNVAEKEYLAFLAKDFARDFRVTNTTSLFDYGFGQSTLSYTDESFPRVHRTVGDLPNDRQAAARKNCEDRGVSGAELKGCIFDNAYLEISPSPRPVITDPTSGVTLARVDRPVINVNPPSHGEVEAKNDKTIPENVTPQTISKPDESSKEQKENPVIISKPPGSSESTKPQGSFSKPVPTTPKPKPAPSVIKPAGTTVKPSSPAPVKSSPSIKGKG